jgi:DNA helicase II / ATP-dependent DNA helicase PcrA
MMFDLKSLNKTQKDAVVNIEGPMMILAGAGSGKTRTLVSRISYILESKKLSPHRLLALTFSNKAAKEMRDRVSKTTELDIGALQITTFHAFCARVLRSEATYLGLSRSFSIYDTSEQKSVVKTILSRHGISHKEISPFEVMYFIEQMKNVGHYEGQPYPEEFEEDEQFYRFFKDYEHELARANAIDFGGLITAVIRLFETHPEVLESYQRRFEYILVDEYQDTNKAQFKLLTMLSEKKRNLCVVGDEDQSIYSWRGADINNILDFEKVFPEASLLKLEQNYRSSKNIINAAGHVISQNKMRKGKNMWTSNPDGESIQVIELANEKDEASKTVDTILSLTKDGNSLDDMAIFYRTNSQSRQIEDALRRSSIAYRVVGGIKFYERKEIKDIVSYLRAVVNEKDSLALSRIINVPARGIGATTLRKVENIAIQLNCSLWESLYKIIFNYEDYKDLRFSKNVRSSLENFITLIDDSKRMLKEKEKPSVILDKILNESGYVDFLNLKKDHESQARLENIEEFKNSVIQFEESMENASLIDFLETITLDTSVDGDESSDVHGEISLMTVHGAKGLEFPYVFILGTEENLFPSYKSMEGGEVALEEERRLFYVAMTRAMKKLYIMFAQSRMLFGQMKFNGPSRFIYEIPNEFYQWQTISTKKTSFPEGNEWDDFNQDIYSDDEKVYQRGESFSSSTFKKSQSVKHAIYGEGLVVSSAGQGASEKVTIKFFDGTTKKFLVKFAPLELV